MATEPVVGVLSLQGAVAEHVACFEKIGCTAREVTLRVLSTAIFAPVTSIPAI
jgi:glutamine amidotransferase PdxT